MHACMYSTVSLAYLLLHNLIGGAWCQAGDISCYFCGTSSTLYPAANITACRGEQRNTPAYRTWACMPGNLCGIIYYLKNPPYYYRQCIGSMIAQGIASQYPWSDLEPVVCQAGTAEWRNEATGAAGTDNTMTCICQGKLCNWYPETSIQIAMDNAGKPKPQRAQIPPIGGAVSGSATSGAGKPAAAGSGGSGSLNSGAGTSGSGGAVGGSGGGDTAGGNAAGSDDPGAVGNAMDSGDLKGGGTGSAGGRSGNSTGNGTTTDPAAQGSGSNLGLIGGVAGAVLLLSAVGGGVYWWRKSRAAKKKKKEGEDEEEDEM
ncbi:apomucin-like isoform X1 [Paramacrobiotus metropolitanus]|uniref:apomucin-like isoform X1 n=1 Tax=Paramacrobiotus metropolitanus TaxID=2943436 RepID=UPI002445BFF5|nr:apomucin-like isoform X1 [Paramacrobiotus metropolitanus]XP_055337862.1 apomucin-like isoform X1 [Paramacrobiotus metropolitanus]XP_055337863.1 apomucin-like isoform X1 [Paramacrobiotus metropolitanus]